jgi:hypothetical protein
VNRQACRPWWLHLLSIAWPRVSKFLWVSISLSAQRGKQSLSPGIVGNTRETLYAQGDLLLEYCSKCKARSCLSLSHNYVRLSELQSTFYHRSQGPEPSWPPSWLAIVIYSHLDKRQEDSFGQWISCSDVSCLANISGFPVMDTKEGGLSSFYIFF